MKIREYEIREQGIQASSYYQGAGTSFTDWDDVFTGIGSNKYDALDDALEQLACAGYDEEGIENEYSDGDENLVCNECEFQGESDFPSEECLNCEMHYYIEVYVKAVNVDDVETYRDHGKVYPSINVKHYNWPYSGISKHFTNADEKDIEKASGYAFDSARERFWEDAQELAEHLFTWQTVKVYAMGRSGGHLAVDGIGIPEEWDQDELELWQEFEKGIKENIEYACSLEPIIDSIEANRWIEPMAERFNFIDTDKGTFCIADIRQDVEAYKQGKYGRVI